MKHLHGFLPVNKPKGVCCNALLSYIEADANFVLSKQDFKPGYIVFSFSKYLEPFATGLVTFIVGRSSQRKRNFVLTDYRYKMKVEFGVDRIYNSIDGDILSHVSIDHISEDLIRSKAREFMEMEEQLRHRVYSRENQDVYNTSSQIDDVYKKMIPPDSTKPHVLREQKYPLTRQPKKVKCKEINLIEYQKPYATFDLLCCGAFNPRRFVVDLSESLDTRASLVELTREMEGPMQLADSRVLELHETHLEYYIHRLASLEGYYKKHLRSLDDQFKPFKRYI